VGQFDFQASLRWRRLGLAACATRLDGGIVLGNKHDPLSLVPSSEIIYDINSEFYVEADSRMAVDRSYHWVR
jgi:hypothetical protein